MLERGHDIAQPVARQVRLAHGHGDRLMAEELLNLLEASDLLNSGVYCDRTGHAPIPALSISLKDGCSDSSLGYA